MTDPGGRLDASAGASLGLAESGKQLREGETKEQYLRMSDQSQRIYSEKKIREQASPRESEKKKLIPTEEAAWA